MIKNLKQKFDQQYCVCPTLGDAFHMETILISLDEEADFVANCFSSDNYNNDFSVMLLVYREDSDCLCADQFKLEDIELAYFSSSPGGEPAKEYPEHTAAVALCNTGIMAETAVKLLELRIQDPLKPVRRRPIPVTIKIL